MQSFSIDTTYMFCTHFTVCRLNYIIIQNRPIRYNNSLWRFVRLTTNNKRCWRNCLHQIRITIQPYQYCWKITKDWGNEVSIVCQRCVSNASFTLEIDHFYWWKALNKVCFLPLTVSICLRQELFFGWIMKIVYFSPSHTPFC